MESCADWKTEGSSQVAQSGNTLAERAALTQFEANARALAAAQPSIAEALRLSDVAELEWVFGRDGSIAARDSQGRWQGGCSAPRAVGRAMMKPLDVAGDVACFLAPQSAGQIRGALERLTYRQAMVAVIPDISAARIALHCEDFSAEITGGRLWLAAGPDWPRQLDALLEHQAGLCIPEQYIRTGLLDEAELSEMVALTNPIFSQATSRRAARIGEMRAARRHGRGDRICFVAGSGFALWDLAGAGLAAALTRQGDRFIRLDTDRPASASPLALAMAAGDCDAVVASNLFRADLPDIVPDDVRWITWATRPRFGSPSPNDHVLLADDCWRSTAAKSGWGKNQLHSAAWPVLLDPLPAKVAAAPVLGLIADLGALQTPAELKGFSSHAVLWEQIAAEIADDPWCVGGEPDAYLSARISRYDIEAANLNRGLFIKGLILPAWLIAVARVLHAARLPIALFGAGWDQVADLSAHARGPVSSLAELGSAAAACSALIHPTPAAGAHPVCGLGRAVLQAGYSAKALTQSALAALSGRGAAAVSGPRLSANLILSLAARRGEN